MQYHGRRRRRRRINYPRLAALVLVLALIVTGVVLLVRGLSRRDDAQQAGAPAVSTQNAVQPEAQDNPANEDVPQSSSDAGSQQGLPAGGADEGTSGQSPAITAGGVRTATIRSIGDIIIHEPLFKTARANADGGFDFSPFFSLISSSMSSADYTVANIDGPTGGKGSRGYKFYPQFNTPPHILTALKEHGVDMLTLANNHALDTYFDGLKATIDNVEKAGLDHVGAYRTQEEFDTPKVVEINGIRVGFLNYTTGTNNVEKSCDPEAVIYGLRYTTNTSAKRDIQSLREAGAEAVVVYMHWGEEYERTPTNAVKKMAKSLASCGADVVVGGHPHVVQPAEWITTQDDSGASRRTLVLYSMGNFLSDQRTRYRDSGIIFEFTLSSDAAGNISVVDPKYVPVYVWRTKVSSGYDYRVVPCGKVIENPPSAMDDETLQRVKEVWSELKEYLGTDVAGIAKS